MIAKRHPDDFSEIEIEPDNKKRHVNQLPLSPVRKWTRQKRFLKSSTSTCWEGDCQRPAHVRRQVCEDLQNIRGNPREVISLYPFLFCGRRLYRTCEEACPHPQIFIATGDDFNTLANLFRVEHSTVRTIICEVVKFPSMEEDFYKPDI